MAAAACPNASSPFRARPRGCERREQDSREHTRHWRQVADTTVHHPEGSEDRGLVGRDRLEIVSRPVTTGIPHQRRGCLPKLGCTRPWTGSIWESHRDRPKGEQIRVARIDLVEGDDPVAYRCLLGRKKRESAACRERNCRAPVFAVGRPLPRFGSRKLR